MPDLDAALLDAALGFSERRLDKLVHQVAPDPNGLLAGFLGRSPSADEITAIDGVRSQVQAHLTAAVGAVASLGGKLAAPPASLSDVGPAARDLATALSELSGAAGLIAGASHVNVDIGLTELLRAANHAVSEDTAGLAMELGLAPAGSNTSAGLKVVSPVITMKLANAVPRTVDPGVPLTLHDSTFTASFDWSNAGSLALALSTGVVAGLASDGFVRKMLPASTAVDVNISVGVDLARGITLGAGQAAGSRHQVAIPAKLALPGIELRDLVFELPDAAELGGADVSPTFALACTIAGKLGPVGALVNGMGVGFIIDAEKASAGLAGALSVAVVPPTGAGLTVNAGLVKGGGYLSVKAGEYGGALDLALGPVEIKAVGLITTDPFSLVLVLSVEFRPAIQLSFGFTLNGVGGLLALERTIDTDALRAGLHNHTADALLFPADPVGAAPHILAALDSDFPQQQGAFVVGPMVELGWGSGAPFVTAKLGVIIALPDPKVILLGAVRVALPTPDAAIVDLRAQLYGEITPEHLLFLVSLEGSKVAGFALSGDFGLLIGFGDDPEFALSAGGFHPHYTPPGELVGMRRVSIDLSPPAFLTLRADAYFALTSNSFQLGAHVQLRADVGVAGAEGQLSFDALVRFSPFSFEIDLSAGISLYAAGMSFASVDLSLHLEGPGLWLAHGTASVSLLFFDIDFEVGPVTWGDGDGLPPGTVSPVALVAEALQKPAAWHAAAPDGAAAVVALTTADVADGILVHPLGAFEVREHVVPLETTIDRIGPNAVSETRVDLGAPTIDGQSALAVSYADDLFPPGLFLDLTDDEKLSRPAFERFPSGMRLAGIAGDAAGTPVESAYQWETVFPGEEPTAVFRPDPVIFIAALRAGTLARGPASIGSLQRAQPYALPPDPVVLADPGTVVIRSVVDLQPATGVPSQRMTTTAAARAIADIASTDPDLAGGLQLVGLGVAP